MKPDRTAQSGPTVTRAERSRRERERRQRRRLMPLVAVVIVILGGGGWLLLGPRGTSSASTAPSVHTHSTTTTTTPPYVPSPVKLTVFPAQSGEGRWSAKDLWYKAPVSVATTFFRTAPGVTAYAAWMRASTTQLALYPGYKGPGPTNYSRGPMMVPLSARAKLLATFNSGFYEADSRDGFFTHGTLYFPMVNNQATLVEYTNGKIDIINWLAGPKPPANILMARQNLHMLVNDSHPGSGVSVGSNWGLTLHGVPAVWRTGVGVDSKGNLIYAAAGNQTAASLAQIFIRLGAIRAMELDINPAWPIYLTYGWAGAGNPSMHVPNPNQVRSRFLYSSTKDFFALYQRVPGQVQVPW